MSCRELISNSNLAGRIRPSTYSDLHSTGRRLISGWLERAYSLRDKPEEHFEAFIYLWIAFNGWAACVSGLDQDRQWLDALSLDEEMCTRFSELTSNENNPLGLVAREFFQMWPIFKAQALRQKHFFDRADEPRQETIRRYISSGVTAFEPKCWTRHSDSNELVPLDKNVSAANPRATVM